MATLADAIKSSVAKYCIAKPLLLVLLSLLAIGALTGGSRAQDPPTKTPQRTPDQSSDSLLGGLGGLLDKLETSGQRSVANPQAEGSEKKLISLGQLASAVFGSAELQWMDVFAQAGKTYATPAAVIFSGSHSGCGSAQVAIGPFYCPLDQKVYLDTTFFDDLLNHLRPCNVGNKVCEISMAYVLAHEIGHHVQNLLGVLPRVQEAQRAIGQAEADSLQVRVELQADCFAGVWASRAPQQWQNIGPGDVEAALQAASAIGDIRLQRWPKGYVAPDAFNHGALEQRVRWFLIGLKSGKISSCDTFRTQEL